MPYDQGFYDEMEEPNLRSARVITPLITNKVSPRSVVDVGCGRGLWLKAFSENGVSNIFGYDGDWVEKDKLAIDNKNFSSIDFGQEFNLNQKADLVVCLEVAEHLKESMSDYLVDQLTKVAPVVLFSAAIPFQGGSGHVNEQWPDYWAKKFAKHNYLPVDYIRPLIWGDDRVSFFYKQNILMYVRSDKINEYTFPDNSIGSLGEVRSLVHPHMYTFYAQKWTSIVPFLSKIPVPLIKILKKVFSRSK